jgi:hypothetical protein
MTSSFGGGWRRKPSERNRLLVVRNDLGGRREKSLEIEINIIYEIAPESRKIFMMKPIALTQAAIGEQVTSM